MITDGNLKDTVIRILRSRVAGRTPTAAAEGELAINETDEILYYRKADGLIPFKSQNKQTCADVAPTQGTDSVTDNTDIITSHADGYSNTNNKTYRRKASLLWNYVKSKIENVLGLTAQNYGGTAAMAMQPYSASNSRNNSADRVYLKICEIEINKNWEYIHYSCTFQLNGYETQRGRSGKFRVTLFTQGKGGGTFAPINAVHLQCLEATDDVMARMVYAEYANNTANANGWVKVYAKAPNAHDWYIVTVLENAYRTLPWQFIPHNSQTGVPSLPASGGTVVRSALVSVASRAHADTSNNVIAQTYARRIYRCLEITDSNMSQYVSNGLLKIPKETEMVFFNAWGANTPPKISRIMIGAEDGSDLANGMSVRIGGHYSLKQPDASDTYRITQYIYSYQHISNVANDEGFMEFVYFKASGQTTGRWYANTY